MNHSVFSLFAETALAPINSLTWVGHIGRILIALGGLLALASVISAFRKSESWSVKFLHAATASFWGAFASLLTLFLTSQFQFRYVQRHNALDHELQYKIAGVWSGQEGSFLLWTICSALCVSLAVRNAHGYKRWFAGVSSMFLAALAGILSFESPFTLNPAGTDLSDGFGMAPSLLNYWVVIHPPTIFVGFGLLTALFAWSVAALLHRDLESWVDQARPWALVSLSFLGVGLCMGGFWAYETLGWGGFWAWDPVENTSLVPWLINAALVHGFIVQKARNKWHLTNVTLAAVPFLTFVYGTFLTRSGFLGDTSVHSFAQMDRSALWILTGLGLTALTGFLAVLFTSKKWWSSIAPPTPKVESFWTKDTFYAYGNWMLILIAGIAAFGMSVPLIQSLRGQKPAVVQESLYNTVTAFPFLPIVLMMAVAPFLTWRKKSLKDQLGTFVNCLAATLATTGFLLLWLKWGGREVAFGNLIIGFPGRAADPEKTTELLLGQANVGTTPWVLFLFAVCSFAIFANLTKGVQLFRKNKLSSASMLTHLGVVLTVAGLIFSRGLEQKFEGVVHESKTIEAFGYQVNLIGNTSSFADRNNKIRMNFRKGPAEFIATPGLYFIPGQDGSPQEFLWPYIQSWPLYDLYVVARQFHIEEDGALDFGGSEPTTVLPGETAQFQQTLIQYQGLQTEGTPGTFGAKFTAVLTITDADGERILKPYVKLLGPGEMERPVVDLGQGRGIYVDSINAADQAATFIIKYTTPAYPVQIFYKPLTILVWYGVGIMALGGTLGAIYRRRRPKSPNSSGSSEPAEPKADNTDATENLVEV